MFIYGIGLVAARGINFLLLPVQTNIFSTIEFGVLSLIGIYIVFANGLFSVGLNEALEKFYLRDQNPNAQKDVFTTVFYGTFITSFIFLAFSVLFASNISMMIFNSREYGSLIELASISVLLDQISLVQFQVLRARFRALPYVSIMLLGALISFSGNIFFVWHLKSGIIGVLWSSVIASGITALVLVFFSLPYLGKIPNFTLAKEMYHYGLPFIPVFVSFATIEMIGRYFLNLYSGTEIVGIYSAAYRIGYLMLMVVMAFNSTWSPFALKRGVIKGAESSFAKTATLFIAGGGLLFLLVSNFLPAIFQTNILGHHFVGSAYLKGIAIIPLVITAYIFFGAYCIFVIGLELNGQTKYLAGIAAFSAAISIAGNMILIPWFLKMFQDGALYAAAISTILSYAFLAICTLGFSQKYYPVPYEWKKIIIITGSAIGCFLLPHSIPSNSFWPKLIFTFAYVMILFPFKVIQFQEIKRLAALS